MVDSIIITSDTQGTTFTENNRRISSSSCKRPCQPQMQTPLQHQLYLSPRSQITYHQPPAHTTVQLEPEPQITTYLALTSNIINSRVVGQSITGARTMAGLSLRADKLHTMGTSMENPSILGAMAKSTTAVRVITILEQPHRKPMLQSHQVDMNRKVRAITSIHNQTPIRIPMLIGHLFLTTAVNILKITRRQMPSLFQRT